MKDVVIKTGQLTVKQYNDLLLLIAEAGYAYETTNSKYNTDAKRDRYISKLESNLEQEKINVRDLKLYIKELKADQKKVVALLQKRLKAKKLDAQYTVKTKDELAAEVIRLNQKIVSDQYNSELALAKLRDQMHNKILVADKVLEAIRMYKSLIEPIELWETEN